MTKYIFMCYNKIRDGTVHNIGDHEMIILRNTTNNRIFEMFDTANEFKNYIRKYLYEMQEGMRADGLEFSEKDVNEMAWSEILDEYQDLHSDEIQIECY